MASEIHTIQSSSSSRDHILLLPFLAKGHLIPFTALATLLELKTSYTITIITTPHNISTVQSFLPQNSTIRIESLPFNGPDHGLPPDAESTDTVPRHLVLRLMESSVTLQPAFDYLISRICSRDGRPPLCIISDHLLSWSVEAARKHGAFHCIFRSYGAYATQRMTSFMKTADQSQIKTTFKVAGEIDNWSAFCNKIGVFAEETDGVLYNTLEELERNALHHVSRNLKRVWAIGPMICARKEERVSLLSCTEWLNTHRPSSVLYISFGSENSVNPPQMVELAKGLEACGTPFIWVVKSPIGSDVDGGCLPVGFQDRMAETKQGMFFRRWAPQMEILAHESTGAFLSHCGWNSTLESLSHGVPVIGWPLDADQFSNSKLLEEELGVGVEMASGCGAEISSADVARVVGMMMDGESEKGKEMRRKARKIQEVMKAAVADEENFKGSSIRALEAFLQTVTSFKENC